MCGGLDRSDLTTLLPRQKVNHKQLKLQLWPGGGGMWWSRLATTPGLSGACAGGEAEHIA